MGKKLALYKVNSLYYRTLNLYIERGYTDSLVHVISNFVKNIILNFNLPSIGTRVGTRVGVKVGLSVGFNDGTMEGVWVGILVGTFVGNIVGINVGIFVGTFVSIQNPQSQKIEKKKLPQRIVFFISPYPHPTPQK